MKNRQHSRLTGCAALCLAAVPVGAQFQSDRVSLESHLTPSDLSAGHVEDLWGYVSPSGREYAIVGVSQGTAFVEITNPAAAAIVDIKLQTIQGRDIKVYQNFVYSTAELGPTYVYDVSNIDNGTVTFVRTFPAGAHNLAVDEVSGFLYHSVGGPLNIYDLSDPSNPALVGTWPGETHDVQAVTYTSGTYAGRQIVFVFSGSELELDIIDVTDKSNIFLVGETGYPAPGYSHQGWLSDDRHYMYLNDELDGIPRTTIIDVSNLSAPTFVKDFSNGLPAGDHNLYLRDRFIFEANYHSGMRIFDAFDPLNPVEVGFFDTYPADDDDGFLGAWTAYPFFPSGTVIVSDPFGGLFVLDPSEATARTLVTSDVCLDGSQTVPPVATGTGTATVMLDSSRGIVSISGTYAGLSSNQTSVHLHQAAFGATGPAVITLTGTGGRSGTFSGSGALAPLEMNALLAGNCYLDVHTAGIPAGDVRGQIVNLVGAAELETDPTLSDCAGDPKRGPRIGDATETFDLLLDCSGAQAPGAYVVVLRLGTRVPPLTTGLGSLWCSNTRVFRCSGTHNQNAVKCIGSGGMVLPNDPALIGIAYCAQGFCVDPANSPGRLSNAFIQVVEG